MTGPFEHQAPALSVRVRHNFETAHRLPFLGGKCTNLHGHSWWVEWQVMGLPTAEVTVTEFGDLKRVLRSWVDSNLDHGTMLGAGDPLIPPLREQGCRVFEFGATDYVIADAEGLATDLPWPTVEATAVLLARVATLHLPEVAGDGLEVVRVIVRETAVNDAVWEQR